MDSTFAKDRAAAAVVAGAAVAAFNVNSSMNGTKGQAIEIGANQHPNIGNNGQQQQQQQVDEDASTGNAVANSANYFASKDDEEVVKGAEKYGKLEDEEGLMGSSPSVTSTINDKRYTCETCKQTFTRKHNLKSHVLIHTSDKPFKCTDCGITFRRGYDLKRHMKTHTKEKPFHCKHCGKGFARADALLRHSNSSSGCGAGNAASASDIQSEKEVTAHDDSEEHIAKRPKIQFQDPVIPAAESKSETAIDESIAASAIDVVNDNSNSSSPSSSKFSSKNSSVDTVYDTLHSLLGNIERAGVDQITSDAMLKLTDVLLGLDERIKILNRRLDQLPSQHH